MRKLLSCLVIALCTYSATLAYAVDTTVVTGGVAGHYFGLQMGISKLDSSDEELPNALGDVVLVKPSNNGYGMRLYWGYQFTNYAALEGGYAYYSPSTYNIPNGNSPQLRIQAIDIVGKGIVPLFAGLSAFIKAGPAIVFYKQGGLLAPSTTGGTDGSTGVTVRPEFGLGASYAFTPNWYVDATVTRITKGGIVPNSDMYTIGISYHAVDLYCGQFLC